MSGKYLMVENPGVAPIQGYTLFGATSKRDHDDTRIIGTFGSGNKHGIALCLRQGVNPVIFCGSQRLTFSKKEEAIESVSGTMVVERVVVRVTGKDNENRSVNYSKELDHTLTYGSVDWTDISFALREFVSNSIDACYEQDLSHKDVVIDLVNENQVRAKSGKTRVFIPCNDEVMSFYINLNKWFLHFSEPESLDKRVLDKANRNRLMVDGRQSQNAVIYRRGVLVREYERSDNPSMFDYNLVDLDVNESRVNNDYNIRYACASSLKRMSDTQKVDFLKKCSEGVDFWEMNFDPYYTKLSDFDEDASQKWQAAAYAVYGENACFTDLQIMASSIQERGYVPVVLPKNVHDFVKSFKVRKDMDVLGKDIISGRELVETTESVRECFDDIWDKICSVGLSFSKVKPALYCFRKMSHASTVVNGYYSNDGVYINIDLCQGVNDKLRHVIMEEIAHHITGATDGSRDFANYLLSLAVAFANHYSGVSA